MARYDTSGNIEAQFEPGSNGRVLRNKRGIQTPEEMDGLELSHLVRLYDELPQRIEYDQQLRVQDIMEWHHWWLGDIYEWAGKPRSVNIGKGGFMFASSMQIPTLLGDFERSHLARYTPCNGMDDGQLAEAIGTVHIEFVLIHPFREGNGRIARVLANVMAMQAGKRELDFSVWNENKEEYIGAIHAGLTDHVPMIALVKQILPSSR